MNWVIALLLAVATLAPAAAIEPETPTSPTVTGEVVDQFLPFLPIRPLPIRRPTTLEGIRENIQEDRRLALGDAKPPLAVRHQVTVTRTVFEGRTVTTLTPRKRSNREVLYLHGGAYVFSISREHWKFLGDLAERSGAVIVVPDYPLAPESTHIRTLNFALQLYLSVNEGRGPRDLILMGDSAGGGLTLALAQRIHAKGLPEPKGILLASPWLDLTLSDPRVDATAAADGVLSKFVLVEEGKMYAGAEGPKDPESSPLFGSLAGLPSIEVFSGTHDILNADSRRLQARARDENVRIDYREYPGMMHVWFLFPVPERAIVIDQMAQAIRAL